MADTDEVTDQDIQDESNPVRQLRQQNKELAKRLKEQEERLAQLDKLEREHAFVKAGIDVDDSRLKYFVKGYDGELTAEAIRAQATKDGFLTQQVTPPDPTLQTHQRIDDAVSQTVNPDRRQEMDRRIAAALSTDEVMAIAREYADVGGPTAWMRQ